MDGVVCDIEGKGTDALSGAIEAATGNLEIMSMSGTLPLVRNLKDGGCDLGITG